MVHTLYDSLTCSNCTKNFDIHRLHNYCHECHAPLVAGYALDATISKEIIDVNLPTMWRYKKLLPIQKTENIISLHEGWTPIVPLHKMSSYLGSKSTISMKDEGINPTGSFKARGMSVAVSKAKELGQKKFCTPTAGNAGSALAAYAAYADLSSKIYMPIDTPSVFVKDSTIMGAEVVQVKGSIRDAGLEMVKDLEYHSMWDVSTMKEPFRLEGKKTLGYEIAEQYQWHLPDVILYPTGGGTGLIGMWKAFEEMKKMHWLKKHNVRLIAVQIDTCCPIVDAFQQNKFSIEPIENPSITAANGLRVPRPFADKMILKAIYDTNGAAISINEEEMISFWQKMAKIEGKFISPEGAILLAALVKCTESKLISHLNNILIINTGSGYKYSENLHI